MTTRLGTVWIAAALIQRIDDTGDVPRWVTVATVMDTPVAIADGLAAARRQHPEATFWVNSDSRGRYIP